MEEVFTTTQLVAVRKHLERGDSITPLEALRLYGTMRLGAIIFKLRHYENMPIKNINPKNKHACYTL